jgi:hypothetical protein
MGYTEHINSILKWGNSFQRQFDFPLDRSSLHSSYADAVAYAKGDKSDSRGFGDTAYIGQVITVWGPNEKGVEGVWVYSLVPHTPVDENDKTLADLQPVGSTTTETAENYSAAIALSSGLTVGQLIKVLNAETTGEGENVLTYQAGFYIVETPGEKISALATSTGSDDEVGALKLRVENVEANKADLTGLTALQEVVNGKVNNDTFEGHTTNADIHVNDAEKAKWNAAADASNQNTTDITNLTSVVDGKADASALDNYLLAKDAYDDTKVRELITAETTARTDAFNTLSSAVDAKASNDDLTTHTTNGVIHVTNDDKEKWNKVAEDFNAFITGDTETALDTLVDLQQWISEHGTEAQAMATAITANLESITSLAQTVDTISGKVDNNTTAITKNAGDIATKAAKADLEALAGIVGNENDNSGIFEKLSQLAGDVANKLTKSATVNGKSFSEDGALVIDSADINLNEKFGKKLVNEVETDRYTTGNTIQYVLQDIDTRIDAINTTIDNVTGGGVIADISAGDGINVDKTSKTTPTISVNTDNSSVAIDSNGKITVKLNTSKNNALSVDGNGLFVQAITIEGDDVEGENSQA